MAKQIPVEIMSFKNKQRRIWKGTFFQAWMDRANCFSPSTAQLGSSLSFCSSSSSSQNWLKWRKKIQLGSAIVWKKIKVTITFSRRRTARGKLNSIWQYNSKYTTMFENHQKCLILFFKWLFVSLYCTAFGVVFKHCVVWTVFIFLLLICLP